MVHLLDSPSCNVTENAGMVQVTEPAHQESRVEVGCASDCDSETSTLVDFSWKDTQHDGSTETSDHECETSILETDHATKAQMLDGDERAWDRQPTLKQEFEGLKAIVLAIFSRRAERHK